MSYIYSWDGVVPVIDPSAFVPPRAVALVETRYPRKLLRLLAREGAAVDEAVEQMNCEKARGETGDHGRKRARLERLREHLQADRRQEYATPRSRARAT